MFIIKVGCCGRYSIIVINLNVKLDLFLEDEFCLYKKNGSCGICVKYCFLGVLILDGYDRYKCYIVLRKNVELYIEFGSFYSDEFGDCLNSVGSEVCGKCVVNILCIFFYKKF